jgi:HlyD family secretion protein
MAFRDPSISPLNWRAWARATAAARARSRERIRASIPTILTGPQLEKYRRLVAASQADPVQSARVWRLGEDGTPVPIDIRIGMTDGSFTEVVEGELAVGTALVTGAAPPARTAASPGVVGRLLAYFR